MKSVPTVLPSNIFWITSCLCPANKRVKKKHIRESGTNHRVTEEHIRGGAHKQRFDCLAVDFFLAHVLLVPREASQVRDIQESRRKHTGESREEHIIEATTREMMDSGRGTTRAEDAQGTPTQSHMLPSILVYAGKTKSLGEGRGATRKHPPAMLGVGH